MARQTESAYYTTAGIYVAQAFEEVTSADKFYAWMRETPNYVPRRVARDVWAQFGEQRIWDDYRDHMDPDEPMLRRFFADVPAIHSQAYNVKIRFSGEDPATGEELESYMILGFDHAPTLGEVEQWALASGDYKPPLPPDVAIRWGIEYTYHREGELW